MKNKKSHNFFLPFFVCIFFIVMLRLTACNADWIEKYYSNGLYPFISVLSRFLFGWIPFSISEVILLLFIFNILRILVVSVRNLIRRQWQWIRFQKRLLRLIRGGIFLYLYFLLFWGLNYYRIGISAPLRLTQAHYSTQELKELTLNMATKANYYRFQLGKAPQKASSDFLFSQAKRAYQNTAVQYPFLAYTCSSIKPSVFSELQNYISTLGYFSPLTGEAQVNVRSMPVSQPFVSCHEIAHQIGFASEDEANFIGYLTAMHSDQKVFRYSASFEMLLYSLHELKMRDSISAKQIYLKLDTTVKLDIKNIKLFYRKYDNRIEPLISLVYGEYLKANNQPQGLDTYNQAVSLMIAFKKKYQHFP